MVSLVWVAVAAASGLLVYLVPPVLAASLSDTWRERVGDFYYKQSLRSFERLAFIDRVIGGYELLPIAVDDEQKHAQVTLDSGTISDDKTLPFDDPDGRIGRLFQKPIAVVYEGVPAAIDAELAELAYWVNQKALDEGIEHEVDRPDGRTEAVVDPYIELPDVLRVAAPLDALSLVCKDIEPENIETTKRLTEERFAKYGSRIGMTEMLTFTGFAFGIGAVAFLQYVRQNLLDGGSGGGIDTTAPIAPTLVPVDVISYAADAVVMGAVG